jgi:hypothetical protein
MAIAQKSHKMAQKSHKCDSNSTKKAVLLHPISKRSRVHLFWRTFGGLLAELYAKIAVPLHPDLKIVKVYKNATRALARRILAQVKNGVFCHLK